MNAINSITKGPRQSNFELLRIVAMFMVLALHANFLSFGSPTTNECIHNPFTAFTRDFLEALCICSVNVFVLISGWFSIRFSIKGLLNFLFQAVVLLLILFIIVSTLGFTPPIKKFVINILYQSGGAGWFVRAYVGLYILSPILNAFVNNSSKKQIDLFLICFYLFQTYYIFSNFVANGYSIFSFIGLYILARRIKLYGCGNFAKYLNIKTYLIASFLIGSLYYINKRYDFHFATQILSYANPLIILSAVSLILTFNKLNLGVKPSINRISASCFAVYILHNCSSFGFEIYKRGVLYAFEMFHGFAGFVMIIVYLIAVFFICITIDQPRKWLWDIISRKIFTSK